MVPVPASFSKFLSMSLVLFSVIFITSLPRIVWGGGPPPRKTGDPRGLIIWAAIDPLQFDLPRGYVGLHPVVNTQGGSPPRVLRRAKFLGVKGPSRIGDLLGEGKIMPMRDLRISAPLTHSAPLEQSTPPGLSMPSAQLLPPTSSSLSFPVPILGSSSTLADDISTSNPVTSLETRRTSSTFLNTNGFPTSPPTALTHTKYSGGPEETSPLGTSTPNEVGEKFAQNSPFKVGATVGGVLGGLVLVSLIGTYVYISRRRRKERLGDWTTPSLSSHNSHRPIERRARLDDTMHQLIVERTENQPFRDEDSGDSGNSIESKFFPRRVMNYVWGRQQKIKSSPKRSAAKSRLDGDPSASAMEEGISNLRNQITLMNARIHQLETQERDRQDFVNSPVSRPPTYRSYPSQHSLDTIPFVIYQTSLPPTEIDPLIKT